MTPRMLDIRIGEVTCRAALDDAQCPATAEAIWQRLPVGFAHLDHARFSGEETSFPVGVMREVGAENQRTQTDPGDLVYFPRHGVIGIYYGVIQHHHPANVFAHIVENWQGAYVACRRTWHVQHVPVRIERGAA